MEEQPSIKIDDFESVLNKVSEFFHLYAKKGPNYWQTSYYKLTEVGNFLQNCRVILGKRPDITILDAMAGLMFVFYDEMEHIYECETTQDQVRLKKKAHTLETIQLIDEYEIMTDLKDSIPRWEGSDQGVRVISYAGVLIRDIFTFTKFKDKHDTVLALRTVLEKGFKILKIDQDEDEVSRMFAEARDHVIQFLSLENLDAANHALKALNFVELDKEVISKPSKKRKDHPTSLTHTTRKVQGMETEEFKDDEEDKIQDEGEAGSFIVRKSGQKEEGEEKGRRSFFKLLNIDLESKEELLAELSEEIIPKEVFVFPPSAMRSAITLFTGDVGISKELLFGSYQQAKVVATSLFVMRESCHRKKLTKREKYDFLNENTPERGKDYRETVTETGQLFDKIVFGKVVDAQKLQSNESLLQGLLKVNELTNEKWNKIVQELPEDHQAVRHYEPSDKEEKKEKGEKGKDLIVTSKAEMTAGRQIEPQIKPTKLNKVSNTLPSKSNCGTANKYGLGRIIKLFRKPRDDSQ